MAEVFISHTSDLADFPRDRSFVQAAIDSVIRARCVPVDMDYFTAAPGETAAYCRRRVGEADIFVSLVGLCYGSIVPGTDVSYTELEFQEASARGKVRLIFILDEDAALPRRLIDSDPARIDDFRRRMQSPDLMVKGFSKPEDLEKALLQSLAELKVLTADAGQHRPDAGFGKVRLAYLLRLRQNYRRIDLDVLTPAEHDDHIPVLLQSVFVPNDVRADPPPMELSKELWRRLFEAGEIGREELPEGLDLEILGQARAVYSRRPVYPVLETVTGPANRLLVLLGDPGAGKTTLARFLALSLADDKTRPELRSLCGWLPVLIELRSFADLRSECPSFLEYLDRLYVTDGLGLPANLLDPYLRDDGRALVIFDGVDEIFDPKEREAVSRQIAGFATRYPKVRILVTSRIIGYRRGILEDAGFNHFTLQDLSIEQISEFVEGWYSLAMRDQPHEVEQRKNRIMRAVEDSPSIRELAGNPLLLTVLTIIGRRQELPRERRAVYAHAAAVLVEQWDVNRHLRDSSVQADYIDSEDRKEMLRRVAARMQTGRSGLAGNHIRGIELVEEFDSYLRGRYQLSPSDSMVVARVMLKQFHTRNFILSRYGGDVYGFIHRAFLEYFCADEIVQRFESRRELSPQQLASQVFGRHWYDESWHEVLLLVAGMVDEKFAAIAIDHLLHAANPQWRVSATLPLKHLSLAVRCLGEIRRLGDMRAQSQAALDHIIDALRYSNANANWTITDAIEQDILPVIAAIGPRLPGRERYRDWFLSGGNELVRTPVALLAALLIAALFDDSQQVHSYLHLQALNAENAALRQAAVRALSQGWHDEPSTLALLKECAIEDSHGYVRQSAVQAIAHGWPGDPEIYRWICDLATSDDDSYVRRGAVLALAQSWHGDKGAGLLLRQRIFADGDETVRHGAANALLEGWADDAGTLSWIREHALNAEDGYIRGVALRALAARSNRDELFALLQDRIRSDDYWLVRQVAVRALASRWRGEGAVFPLLRERAREDPRVAVRQAAVKALGTGWGDGPHTLSFLRECAVFDPEWDVRRAAMQVLAAGWRNDPGTRRWLHERIASADDDTVRQAAIEALAVGWREQKDTRPLLLKHAVSDVSPWVRGAALQALSDGWRDQETFLFIRERCEADQDIEVREIALRALAAKWRHQLATARVLRGCAVREADWEVRRTALQALAEGWSDDPLTYLLLHDVATADGEGVIRRAALQAFVAAWREDPDVLVLLQDRATIDRHGDVRRVAVEALAAEWADNPDTLPLLRDRAANDQTPAVRRAAVRAVANGWHDHPGTLSLLRARAMGDMGWEVREAALRAVANGWHDHPGTLPLLRERVANDPDPAVRRAAVRALANGWHDDPATLPLLQQRTADGFWEVREAAIRALASGWHDDPATLPLLRQAVADSSPEVRAAAARALANARHDEPRPVPVDDAPDLASPGVHARSGPGGTGHLPQRGAATRWLPWVVMAWMPLSCRSGCMVAASTSYGSARSRCW